MALAQMMTGDMQDAMAIGMQMSVVCSEDAESMVTREEHEDTVLGNLLPQGMATICKVWPKRTVRADFHEALATDVPRLGLDGEFAAVTSPRYGEEVAETLPNGRLFVLKGQGHSVLGAGCKRRLFAQFVETADASALDGA